MSQTENQGRLVGKPSRLPLVILFIVIILAVLALLLLPSLGYSSLSSALHNAHSVTALPVGQ